MSKGLLQQVNSYRRSGVGAGGALLKHSLYPIRFLTEVLPATGTILDLGCGEGMLTNLLAVNIPGARFHGIDLDAPKIALAQKNAPTNATFACQDIKTFNHEPAAAVIFNDVLHHAEAPNQGRMLAKALDLLDEDGVLVLKEVDPKDQLDRRWTSFCDQRLYPKDKLTFHARAEWERLLQRAGFRLLSVYRVKHPWPASRTVLVATKRAKHPPLPSNLGNGQTATLRVLVTGGTGFVGQHVIRELERNSGRNGPAIDVTVLVRDQLAIPREWKEAKPPLRFLEHDLTRLSPDAKLGPFDYVFHLAANVDFFANQASAQENVAATTNLLRAVAGPGLKRFILASTFGAVDRAPTDDCTHPLDEQSTPHPTSLYGQSKLDSEKAVKESGLPHTIVRLPWCYGPGMAQRHHVRSLFERSLRGSLLLKIDWPGKVSVAEVRDLARVLWQIASEPKALNETFFVSDGSPISFGSFFRAMGQISGHKAGYLRIPAPAMQVFRWTRRFLPFQLKCLLFDALTVSSDKLKAIAELPSPRSDGFLLPLARYVHQDLFPGRARALVLITGAASGIGKAFSERCYAAGYRLLLVDRNASALKELATELEAEVLVADLSRGEDVERLSARFLDADQCPDILINNAGIGLRNVLTALNASDLSALLGVNCAAPMKLTQAFLRESLRRRKGTVINIGSSAAFQPLPYMAAYAASKAFLVSFSEAIAGELQANGDPGALEVITVIPSGTATGFQNAAGVKRKPGEKLLDPADVAQVVLSQVGRGSRTVTIGSSAKLMGLAARALPRGFQVRLWQRMMEKMR